MDPFIHGGTRQGLTRQKLGHWLCVDLYLKVQMPRAGDIFDHRYRILRNVGAGGIGVVFEAVRLSDDRRVAIKTLREKYKNNLEMASRFVREGKIASRIKHRCVVDVLDIRHAESGEWYLVMEFLDGFTLAEMIADRETLDLCFTSFVVREVLLALSAAHAHEIVHLDLKPENIFLVDDGSALPKVKLIDFGVSRSVDQDSEEPESTSLFFGTPAYMAPEQANGCSDLDHRVDIYSAGVVLYKCLTGEVPFEADNFLAWTYQILNGVPRRPRQIRSDIPASFESLILCAMARQENKRFNTAEMMAMDLSSYADRQVVAYQWAVERKRRVQEHRQTFSNFWATTVILDPLSTEREAVIS